jgi:hypothetical protein
MASFSIMSSRSMRPHGGDLGHAQARAVVRQPDVALQLVAHLVQRGAHEAEVLLRGIGAAKTFGGGAIGHVVQQALAGGPDHGHDVGALLGGGARLHDVFKDVAGGHDEIQPRRTRFTHGRDLGGACIALALDVVAGQARLFAGAALRGGQVARGGQRQAAGGHGLCHLLRRPALFGHGGGHHHGSAQRQQALGLQVVHHAVGQRHLVVVHTVHAHQAQAGAFHRGGGVGLHLVCQTCRAMRRAESRALAMRAASSCKWAMGQFHLGSVIGVPQHVGHHVLRPGRARGGGEGGGVEMAAQGRKGVECDAGDADGAQRHQAGAVALPGRQVGAVDEQARAVGHHHRQAGVAGGQGFEGAPQRPAHGAGAGHGGDAHASHGVCACATQRGAGVEAWRWAR